MTTPSAFEEAAAASYAEALNLRNASALSTNQKVRRIAETKFLAAELVLTMTQAIAAADSEAVVAAPAAFVRDLTRRAILTLDNVRADALRDARNALEDLK